MNLLSDKIHNYQVKHVLSQELIKTSKEYYVRAVLKYAFPERFSGLQKSETPDLQDVKKSLGVEVTWGDSHISEIISGESYKYTQANTQADKEKCLKKIRKNGGDRNLVLTSYPLSTSEGSLTCIQKAFQNKKSKIEKYRQNVQCIGLAMIIDIPIIIISDYHWEESLTNQNNNGFDFAVLVHWSGVDLYDFNTKKYIFKMISKQEMLTLKKIGRLTAEGIITVEDDVWI